MSQNKQDRPDSSKQSLYANLVIVTVPLRLDDPPVEQATRSAALLIETVPFPLPDRCAAGCLARQNDGDKA